MSAIPIWFVTPESYDAVRAEIGEPAAALRRSLRLRAQAGPAATPALGRGRPRRRAVRRGPRRSARSRASSRPACRRAPIASPSRRTDPDLATLAFLLARYRFDRYKAAPRPAPTLDDADAARRAHRRGGRAWPRSRQPAGQCADADGAGARGRRARRDDSRAEVRGRHGRRPRRRLSADPRGRRRGGGAAAAGRFHLGPARTRRR